MRRLMSAFIVAAAVGCVEPPKPKSKAAPAIAEDSTKTPMRRVSTTPIPDKDIPIPADFANEVEKAIDKTNYKSALDALEAELKAD